MRSCTSCRLRCLRPGKVRIGLLAWASQLNLPLWKTVKAELLDSTAVRVVAGSRDALPDVHQQQEDHRAARASWQANHDFREEVVTRLEADLAEAVREHTVPIVECLRTALDELLVEVRKAVAVLPEDVTRDGLIDQPLAVQKAWKLARSAADRYQKVWAAYGALSISAGDDTDGEFAIMRNRAEVWPRPMHTNLHGAHQRPWPDPSQQPENLIWMVKHGADLYLPMPGERTKLWRERYADRLRDQETARLR